LLVLADKFDTKSAVVSGCVLKGLNKIFRRPAKVCLGRHIDRSTVGVLNEKVDAITSAKMKGVKINMN